MTNPTAHIAEDDWDRHWQDYAEAAQRNPAQRYRFAASRVSCFSAMGVLEVREFSTSEAGKATSLWIYAAPFPGPKSPVSNSARWELKWRR